jgi:hypothetical protein
MRFTRVEDENFARAQVDCRFWVTFARLEPSLFHRQKNFLVESCFKEIQPP